MKLRAKILFFILTLVGFSVSMQGAETAAQLMNRVAQAVKNAKTITASFTLSGAAGNMSGTFTSSGKKFAVVTNGPSTWFNGTLMWTYNPRTSETTLVKPTASEIAESNPFNIISAMSSSFNANYAKTQPKGSHVLVLFPKKASQEIKKVVLTLDEKRCVPTKIVITQSTGVTTMTVTKFAANTSVTSSVFEYPKTKYPKVKIIDLR